MLVQAAILSWTKPSNKSKHNWQSAINPIENKKKSKWRVRFTDAEQTNTKYKYNKPILNKKLVNFKINQRQDIKVKKIES